MKKRVAGVKREETHILKRLDDSVHINDLRLVGLEWEINIDSSDTVNWHFGRIPISKRQRSVDLSGKEEEERRKKTSPSASSDFPAF